MGCFLGQKNRKKQAEQSASKTVNLYENKPALLPEPAGCGGAEPQEGQSQGVVRSGPPSFRSKVRTVQHVNWLINNRPRALSAPSSFSRTERDAGAETSVSAKSEQELEEKQRVSPPPGGGKRALSVSDRNKGAHSHSGPVSPSLGMSGPLCSDKKAFSGQPVPLPSPRPLPLPHETSNNNINNVNSLKNFGSLKGSIKAMAVSFSEPMPLPPPDCPANLRSFTYEELATSCHKFALERRVSDGPASAVYKASVKDEVTGQKIAVAVTCLHPTSQPHKEFVNEVNTIASLEHPHLCKLIGYHAVENGHERMLVYERLPNGGLDRLLYGRADGPPIDWSTRMRIVLGAARGLAYLHEEGPFQAMYSEFKPANIQIDKDFSAKLFDYGFASYTLDGEVGSSSSTALAHLAPETLVRGLLTPKSNVWSFGVVLLELLTGRQNMESCYPKEERNLVKWTRPFLVDEFRLSLIMDPKLKGRFSIKAAKIVAELALRCLQKEPSERPTMRAAVEMLKSVQDMKYSSKFPLKEPTSPMNDNTTQQFSRPLAVSPPRALWPVPAYSSQSYPNIVARESPAWRSEHTISRSPSLNGLRSSSTHAISSTTTLAPLSPLKPLVLPPRSCASTFALEEVLIKQCKEAASPGQQPARVEGF